MKRPNIILITADSLRGDYSAFLSKIKKPMFLSKVSEEGILFEKAYSCGPATPFSFPAIMTGTWPLFDAVPKVGPRITISEVLRRNGYITIGIISANPYARYFSGDDRGFLIFHEVGRGSYREKIIKDLIKTLWRIIRYKKKSDVTERIAFVKSLIVLTYDVMKPRYDILRSIAITSIAKVLLREPPSDVTPSQMDRLVTQRALRILDTLRKDNNKPFFLWLHYMSTHIPYGISYEDEWTTFMENLKRKTKIYSILRNQKASKKLVNKLKEYYSKSILELDRNVKTLFEGLEEMKLLDDTILIFTSDHGEEFFEHGNFGHLPKMYDENLRIPLFIWGLEEKRKVNDYVSSVDIFPTIIEIAGLSKTKLGRNLLRIIDGQNLLNPKEGRVIISETLMGSEMGKMLIKMALHKKVNPTEYSLKVAIRATSSEGSCWGSFDLRDKNQHAIDRCDSEKLREIIFSRANELRKMVPRDEKLKLIYITLRKAYGL